MPDYEIKNEAGDEQRGWDGTTSQLRNLRSSSRRQTKPHSVRGDVLTCACKGVHGKRVYCIEGFEELRLSTTREERVDDDG